MGGRGGSSGAGSSGGKAKAAKPTFSPMTSKELKNASNTELRESLRQLATEYYSSGKSGISFGGADINHVVDSLITSKTSRTSMLKDYKSIKKRMGYK